MITSTCSLRAGSRCHCQGPEFILCRFEKPTHIPPRKKPLNGLFKNDMENRVADFRQEDGEYGHENGSIHASNTSPPFPGNSVV
jgi:hypothetical protein